MAAKMSTTECCFTKATDMHTKKQKMVTRAFVYTEALFSFNQVDAMPME